MSVTATTATHSSPAAPADARIHLVLLAISLAVVVAAAILHIDAAQKVWLPGASHPIPGTCAFHNLTGVDCPTCGMTRCFISLAHGNLAAAWHYNAVGIVLFLFVVVQIPYQSVQLWHARRGRASEPWGAQRAVWCLALITAALLIQWLVRVVPNLWS